MQDPCGNPPAAAGNATMFTTGDPGRFVIAGAFGAADAEPDRLIEHIRTAAVPPRGTHQLAVPHRGTARRRGGSRHLTIQAPPDAFVRGTYRRLRVGPYRVLYEVEEDLITTVRVDRV